MSSLLITGIAELATVDADDRVLHDAALVIERDSIAWIGSIKSAPSTDRRVDLGGRAMLPGWVDSHSHLVFAGDRAAEFVARMAGEPYAAGGIAVTVDATCTARVDQLRDLVVETRVWEALLGGTTCLETKPVMA
ncbi:MAG: hypothetical protein U0R21_08150 [Nocardioidaceae bacterium]